MVPSARAAPSTAPVWLIWAALLVVYVVWGSTYLAIRVVVDSMPPFLAAGARFLTAGVLLSLLLMARSGPGRMRITRQEARGAAFVGAALLLVGNGFVSVGEETVPSGLAALIVGVIPLVVLVLRALAGERISRAGVGGVVLGFVGLGILVLPRGIEGTTDPVGMGLLIIASTSWATGSFFSRRLAMPGDALVSTAYQLLFGGALLLLAGSLLGELPRAQAGAFTTGAVVSLVYLVVFGSLLAYTAYTWLLQNAPISKVATYAYVNPVVAVALGVFVLDERLDVSMLVGAVLVIASVAFIVRTGSTPAVGDAATGFTRITVPHSRMDRLRGRIPAPGEERPAG